MTVTLDVPVGVTPDAHLEWRPVWPPFGPDQQTAAGRRAVAAALAAAGSVQQVVPRDPGGRPRFPAGFPGSISHTDRMAVAVVVPGAEAVGVDIECADIAPRVTEFVLRERERRTLLPPAGRHAPRDLFSAKEAAFKALSGNGNAAGSKDFLFWRIELHQTDDVLIASYGGVPVPVWVRSAADLSLAVAIRGKGNQWIAKFLGSSTNCSGTGSN